MIVRSPRISFKTYKPTSKKKKKNSAKKGGIKPIKRINAKITTRITILISLNALSTRGAQ